MSHITQWISMAAVALAGVTLFFKVPRIHPAVIAYVLLVAFWGWSVPTEQWDSYLTLVKLALLAVAVHCVVRTPQLVLMLLSFYALAGVASLVFNWNEISQVRYAMETAGARVEMLRFDGTFANANRAGIFAAFVSVCGLIVFFNLRHWGRWVVLGAGFTSGLVIGGLSGSRTGMLGLLLTSLSVPLMAVIGQPGHLLSRWFKATLAIVIVGIVAAAGLLQLPQFERFLRLSEGVYADGSTETRWGMAVASYKVWKEYPVAGAGFRGFERESEFPGRSVHSAFGQVLADGGLIGFTLIAIWYFLPGYQLIRLLRGRCSAESRRLAFGLFVYCVVFVVSSTFSHLHASRDLIPLWAGICGAIQHLRLNPSTRGESIPKTQGYFQP